MRTSTVQMRTDYTGRRKPAEVRTFGFTLAESMVVMVIASLLLIVAMINFRGLIRGNTFKGQIYEFVSTMQMAARAAAESDRRYEVIVDIPEQSYLLREISSSNLSEVLEEEIIAEADFSDNCQVVYVLFDDGDYTSDSRAKFRTGHYGWQYGGIVVFMDEDEQVYSVIVNRMNRIVSLEKGEAWILEPKFDDELFF